MSYRAKAALLMDCFISFLFRTRKPFHIAIDDLISCDPHIAAGRRRPGDGFY